MFSAESINAISNTAFAFRLLLAVTIAPFFGLLAFYSFVSIEFLFGKAYGFMAIPWMVLGSFVGYFFTFSIAALFVIVMVVEASSSGKITKFVCYALAGYLYVYWMFGGFSSKNNNFMDIYLIGLKGSFVTVTAFIVMNYRRKPAEKSALNAP